MPNLPKKQQPRKLHTKNNLDEDESDDSSEFIHEVPRDIKIQYGFDETFAEIETINLSRVRQDRNMVEMASIIEMDKIDSDNMITLKRSKSTLAFPNAKASLEDNNNDEMTTPYQYKLPEKRSKSELSHKHMMFDIVDNDNNKSDKSDNSSLSDEFLTKDEDDIKITDHKGVTRKHLQFINNFRTLPTLDELFAPQVSAVSEPDDYWMDNMEGEEAEEDDSEITIDEDDETYQADLAKYRELQATFPDEFSEGRMEEQQIVDEEAEDEEEIEKKLESETESDLEEASSEEEDPDLNFDRFDDAIDELDGKVKGVKLEEKAGAEPLDGFLTGTQMLEEPIPSHISLDPEEELLRKEKEAMEISVKSFVNHLINYCAKMSEKYSEQNWLRANVNKYKLVKDLLNLFNEMQIAKGKNAFLIRKCFEYYRRAKRFSCFNENVRTMQADMERYNNSLKRLDLVLRKQADVQDHLKITMDKLDMELAEASDLYHNASQTFSDLVHKSFNTAHSPKMEMIVNDVFEKMIYAHNGLSQERFKIIMKQHDVAGLLKELASIDEKLDMKGYMSMETEAISTEKKLEDRTADLIKLQENNQRKIAMFCHLKEKQEMCLADQERKLIELERNFGFLWRLQGHFYNVKRRRTEIREEIRQISINCGLLDKPNIIVDYDRTMEQIEENLKENIKLRKKYAQLNKQLEYIQIPPMPTTTLSLERQTLQISGNLMNLESMDVNKPRQSLRKSIVNYSMDETYSKRETVLFQDQMTELKRNLSK